MASHRESGLVAPGLSHVRGPVDRPLLSAPIYRAFRSQAEKQGQRTALVVHHQKLRWSFLELLERTDRIAAGLRALGLGTQDRMGVWMPNNSEWLLSQLATAKLGAILVNVNPDYRLPELEYALNLVACKALVLVPRSLHSDFAAMARELLPELATCRGLLTAARVPSLKRVILVGDEELKGSIPWESLYTHADSVGPELASSCDEAVNIQFTSGTTGKPKASTLSHRNILNNGYFVGQTMRYTADDVICIPVPLYHCFGCVMGNLPMVATGCCLVYPANRFDPLMTLEATVQYRCTSLYGVPTMFIAMLDHPDFSKFRFEVLRTGIMAGALCPVDTMNRVISQMGAREVTICYGMTETSPVSFQTRIGTPLDLTCSTVGQIHPHAESMVVDPESGKVLPCNTPGEIWTSGYCVMRGYWENEAATRSSIVEREGRRWMRTGDLGTFDEQGFCQIVGRIKDMICRGGENIFPKEVEEPLIAHPQISNASVIGVPDVRLGEQVCAWVSWKGGAPSSEAARQDADRTIREYLKDRVAHFKVPKYIVFKDDFPQTVTGKIRKVEMREISARELGLLEPPKPQSRL